MPEYNEQNNPGMRYKSKDELSKYPKIYQKGSEKKANIGGGSRAKDKPANYVRYIPGYHGDRIGLIHIRVLMLGDFFKKRKRHAK